MLTFFYGINDADKKWTFLDHLPCLVNAVCEQPLMCNCRFKAKATDIDGKRLLSNFQKKITTLSER